MKLLLPILLCLFLHSCVSTFQFTSLDSPSSTRGPANEIVLQQDSVTFTYNFNKNRGPVQVRIDNVSDHLVSIDWKRSALIVNDRSISLAPGFIIANGSLSAVSIDSAWRSTSTSGQVNMNVQIPSDIAYLAPHSYTEKPLPDLFMQLTAELPDSIFSPFTVKGANGFERKGREASFVAGNSPFTFRGYFFTTMGDTLMRTVVIQHSFYVSRLREVNAEGVPEMMSDRNADGFLITKPVQYKTIVAQPTTSAGKIILKNTTDAAGKGGAVTRSQ